MKILMIFVDMLRMNLLNIYDDKNNASGFDRQLYKLGGTVYKNAFTSSPDTPRSNGSLWTSNYPKFNGCNNRLKYPKYYLNEGYPDFLALLKNKNYKMNFYIAPAMRSTGELPPSVNEYGTYSDGRTLSDFLKSISCEDNSLTFLGFNDFHQVISDCFGQEKYLTWGFNIVGNIIETIDSILNIDSFDLSIIYSDHGFKKREENFDTILKMLDRARTQIFLFVHQKGDKGIQINDKLHSIMDIYPTICDCCRVPYSNIVGKNLLKGDGHEKILIEDHRNFSVSLGQAIENYAVRTEHGLACIDCEGNWSSDYSITEEEKGEFLSFLSENATDFSENLKMTKILKYYQNFLVACPTFFDGSPRRIHKPIINTIRDISKSAMTKGSKSLKRAVYCFVQRRNN